MIINGQTLLEAAPIKNMLPTKQVAFGMTYGCSEAGYDIRVKQEICFYKDWNQSGTSKEWVVETLDSEGCSLGTKDGKFSLASSIEEFDMSPHLIGRVCDKSSWARKGLSVFNTVIEPGWKGFLTLELVYHGNTDLVIPAGAPIAQVLFEEVLNPVTYKGRYQNQEDKPVPAKEAE